MTPREAAPWVRYRKRGAIFRESVIHLCRGFGIEVKFSENEKAVPCRDQQIGQYCDGKDIEECRRMFGEALPRVCSTCPD